MRSQKFSMAKKQTAWKIFPGLVLRVQNFTPVSFGQGVMRLKIGTIIFER